MGTGLPQVNARLVSVAAIEFLGDGYRDEVDESPPRWLEDEDGLNAYFQEKRRWTQGAEGQDLVVSRSLIVPERIALAAQFAAGDVVAFEFGQASLTGSVSDVERRTLPGHPLQSTRLTLADVGQP